MNSIMIAGTKSGVGKTTVAMGLMAAFSRKMTVQAYKVGPDYIDPPAFHSYITGRPCRNLDSYLMDQPMINHLFCKNMKDADLGIVEGVMGLFDGAGVTNDVGSSASVAKQLRIPVILVVDGSKVANSIAATVKGFETFDQNLWLAGVILNNVGSEYHYDLLKKSIEYNTGGVTPVGYLKKDTRLTMPERHLGLVPACEHQNLDDVFELLAQTISETVDLEAIYSLATKAEVVDQGYVPDVFNSEEVRIGIPRDKAFNFYYQDGLDLLEDYGHVKWVPFSPLEDEALPDNLHGLYIGGGFPEVFAKELTDNGSFTNDLKSKLEGGLPYIAECGGLMYLCDELIDLEDKAHKMVGWFDGKTVMKKRLQRFGYATLNIDSPCAYGDKGGDQVRVHEFHRSEAEVNEKMVYYFEKHRDGECIKSWSCGYKKGNGGVGAYAHLHFASNLEFGQNFVKTCLAYKRNEVD